MSDIEALSHVDLLDAYTDRQVDPRIDGSPAPYYAEILRRMDSFTRADIALNPDEYRR